MINGASDRTHRIKIQRPQIVADGYGGQKRAFEDYMAIEQSVIHFLRMFVL